MADRHIFKVVFFNQGQVYEVFARNVSQGGLFGFIEVEGLLFGERSQVVIDPSEETLKNEFEGVKRFYVPLNAVVRVDEVKKRGVSRITQPSKDAGNLTPFPAPIFPKPEGDSGKN